MTVRFDPFRVARRGGLPGSIEGDVMVAVDGADDVAAKAAARRLELDQVVLGPIQMVLASKYGEQAQYAQEMARLVREKIINTERRIKWTSWGQGVL